MLSVPPPCPREQPTGGVPRVPRGLTGAALAVLPQLVIAAAPALVLGQRHLHAVVLAAAVVQGTGVHHCGEKDMKFIGKCCVTGEILFRG